MASGAGGADLVHLWFRVLDLDCCVRECRSSLELRRSLPGRGALGHSRALRPQFYLVIWVTLLFLLHFIGGFLLGLLWGEGTAVFRGSEALPLLWLALSTSLGGLPAASCTVSVASPLREVDAVHASRGLVELRRQHPLSGLVESSTAAPFRSARCAKPSSGEKRLE